MRIVNLRDCFIYSPVTKKVDGEATKKWQFKTKLRVNIQQDISELDTTTAGLIDYERLKIRYDRDIPIEKNDGISLFEIKLQEDFCIESPEYIVMSKTKVGRCVTCICVTNQKK